MNYFLGVTATGALAADFDWQKHKGKGLSLLLNKHPYADAMIADLDNFKQLTGMSVKYDAVSIDGKAKTVLQVTATLGLLASAAWPSAGLGPAANALVVAAAALTLLSGVRLVLRARQTTAHPA